MNRRDFMGTCGLGGLAAALGGWACKTRTTVPNFVFILVDDLGWRDLGCFGSDFYETPNIDRLAREGMRFTQAYAACPVCSPTRASILTGKFPARMQTTDYFGAPQPDSLPESWRSNKKLLPAAYRDHLPPEEITLAEALKEAGYVTFFAGKWHLGPEGFYPEDNGFDINKGGWERGGPYGGDKYFSPYGNPRLADGPEGEHLPDRLAEETCRFIDRNRDRPFMAYLSFYSVHTPLMTRPDLEAKYEAKAGPAAESDVRWGREGARKVRLVQNHAVYAGMVEAVDQAVNKVAAKLEDLALDGNTVIFLMSDNGGLSTSEGHPTSNLPLRAGKGWLYEGGIREPMIVKWPGVTRPGSVCAESVVSTDFYPTILDMAGLPFRPDQHLDGFSLCPLLKGSGLLESRDLFWHYPHYGNQGGSPSGAIRAGDFKLIEFFEDGRAELYNIREDIGEMKDLSRDRPDLVRELEGRLRSWREKTGALMPRPNPDYGGDNRNP